MGSRNCKDIHAARIWRYNIFSWLWMHFCMCPVIFPITFLWQGIRAWWARTQLAANIPMRADSEATGSRSCNDPCAARIWRYNIFLLLWMLCFPLHFLLHFILDYKTRIPRSVLGRYLGRIDSRFHISRDLWVESSPKVSEAGPGLVCALRPNSASDFQYWLVLDIMCSQVKPGLDPTGIHYWL